MRRRQAFRQPAGRLRIAPEWRGDVLIAAVPDVDGRAWVDVANGVPIVTRYGTPGVAVSDLGIGLSAGSNQGLRSENSYGIPLNAYKGMTLLLVAADVATVSGFQGVLGFPTVGGGSTAIGLQGNNSGTDLALYINSSAFKDALVLSGEYDAAGPMVLAVSVDLATGGAISVAINGAVIRTTTGGTFGNATIGRVNIGVERAGSGPGGKYYGAALLGRKLSDSELVGLTDNPSQLIDYGRRGVYSQPTGGTAAQIAGTQTGAGAQTGDIVTAIQAAGIQIGLGSQSGALSTAITLAGTVTGVGTQSGDLLIRIEIDADVLGAGLQALSLATGISVAGLIAGEGAASGGIVTTITIGGQQLADSLIAGGIATAITVAGQQIGGGAQSGELGGGPAMIAGNQVGAGAQSLIISTSITLTGQQIADALLSGSLSTELRIGAIQDGAGLIIGALNTAIEIRGSVSGLGAASGAIVVGQVLIWYITARRITVPASLRSATVPAQARHLIVPA